MLAHCLRRWTNIKPALGQRLVFTSHRVNLHSGLKVTLSEVKKDAIERALYEEILLCSYQMGVGGNENASKHVNP